MNFGGTGFDMGLLLLACFVLDLAFSACSSINVEVGEAISFKLHMVRCNTGGVTRFT